MLKKIYFYIFLFAFFSLFAPFTLGHSLDNNEQVVLKRIESLGFENAEVKSFSLQDNKNNSAFLVFDFKFNQKCFGPYGKDELPTDLKKHFKSIQSFASLDAKKLITKQKIDFERVISPFAPEIKNHNLVLSHSDLYIRKTTRIELCLFQVHQMLTNGHPRDGTEFFAFILTKETAGNKKIRVIMSSSQDHMVSTKDVLAGAQKSKQDGWKIIANLHNHPFIDNPFKVTSAYAGFVPMPSQQDIRALRDIFEMDIGEGEAWITNLISTFRIDMASVPKFHVWGAKTQ